MSLLYTSWKCDVTAAHLFTSANLKRDVTVVQILKRDVTFVLNYTSASFGA